MEAERNRSSMSIYLMSNTSTGDVDDLSKQSFDVNVLSPSLDQGRVDCRSGLLDEQLKYRRPTPPMDTERSSAQHTAVKRRDGPNIIPQPQTLSGSKGCIPLMRKQPPPRESMRIVEVRTSMIDLPTTIDGQKPGQFRRRIQKVLLDGLRGDIGIADPGYGMRMKIEVNLPHEDEVQDICDNGVNSREAIITSRPKSATQSDIYGTTAPKPQMIRRRNRVKCIEEERRRLRRGPKSCWNCGTTETSQWRRSSVGRTVCNACGLHLRPGMSTTSALHTQYQEEQLAVKSLHSEIRQHSRQATSEDPSKIALSGGGVICKRRRRKRRQCVSPSASENDQQTSSGNNGNTDEEMDDDT